MLPRLLLLAGMLAASVPGCRALLGLDGGEAAWRTYRNPVVTPVAADPTLVRAADGTWYLFATQDAWGDGRGDHLMPIFASQDLVTWRFVGDVFARRPAWKARGGLWAPHVAYRDGTYDLYYSYSTWGDPNPCIGLARAPHPAGPWTDLGRAVFCSADIRVANSIDPFVWDDGGRRTMIWGSFNGIFAVPLSADGTRADGEKTKLADERFEAAFVHRRGGYYYLFVSAGSCCEGPGSTYTTHVGRSRSLLGPYLDVAGRDLRRGGGHLVLAGNDAWKGPGHVSVIMDEAGDDWLVYHAIPAADPWLPGGATRRPVLLDRIMWRNGWPFVDGPGTTLQPAPAVR